MLVWELTFSSCRSVQARTARTIEEVCSAKCRHQSPEWMILSHVDCFIQGEDTGFQVLLNSLHPCSTRVSSSSPNGQLLRSTWHVLSGIHAMWQNRQRRPVCTIAQYTLNSMECSLNKEKNSSKSWLFDQMISCFTWVHWQPSPEPYLSSTSQWQLRCAEVHS